MLPGLCWRGSVVGPVAGVGLAYESVSRPGPLCVRVCAASAWRAFVASVGLVLARVRACLPAWLAG